MIQSSYLWRQRQQDPTPLALSQALTRGASALTGRGSLPAYGLFFGTREFRVALIDEKGQPRWPDSPNAPRLESFYEARVFSGLGELRWRSDPDWGPVCAMLSKDENVLKLDGELERLETCGQQTLNYLIWGEGTGPQEGWPRGWSALTSRRVGRLAIPVLGLERGQRAMLKAEEHFRADEETGNVYVAEELLLGIEKRYE